MIINIRGTGGSGKSTIVRSVMERYLQKAPAFVEGRKQPIGYLLTQTCSHDGRDAVPCPECGRRPLWVPGHYETACGGCDTIKTPAEVFHSVWTHADQGYDVIFEGIICQDDTKRTLELFHDIRLKVIVYGLTTPVDICLAGIQSRRDTRGDVRPLNPKNTTERAARVTKTLKKLKDAGMDVRMGSREEVLNGALKDLGLSEAPRVNG